MCREPYTPRDDIGDGTPANTISIPLSASTSTSFATASQTYYFLLSINTFCSNFNTMLKNKNSLRKTIFWGKNLKGIWEKKQHNNILIFSRKKTTKKPSEYLRVRKKTTIWIKPTKTICEIQYLWHLQQQQQYKKYISEITQCNTVLWSVPDARRMRRFVQVFGCKQLKTKFKNQIRIGYHQQQHQTPPAATTPNTSTELVR